MSNIEMDALKRALRYGMATDVGRQGPLLVPRRVARLRNALSRIVTAHR
jgi:hypothetical protein